MWVNIFTRHVVAKTFRSMTWSPQMINKAKQLTVSEHIRIGYITVASAERQAWKKQQPEGPKVDSRNLKRTL